MTLLLIIALIVTLLVMATLIGTRLPKTHVAASRMEIAAPLEQVWEVVMDFKNYPTWRLGLNRVETGPELDGKPTWFEYCTPTIKVQLQLALAEPRTRIVTQLVGEKLPIFGAWDYRFQSQQGSTLITITEWDKIYSPLFRFFSQFIVPHHAAMDVFLIALARHFESPGEPEHLSLRKEK